MSSSGDAVSEFLGARSPFQELDEPALSRIVAGCTLRRVRRGDVVAEYGSTAPAQVCMIHSGRVSLIAAGVDATGDETTDTFEIVSAGGLFGYLPLIIGTTARFVARATEPTVVIELPTDEMSELFRQRAGLVFLASSAWQSISARQSGGRRWSGSTRVSELITRTPVFVDPDTPVHEAARAMGAAGESCVLIKAPDGTVSIVTESDITHRVVGEGLPTTVPVAHIMNGPARAVDADRYAITTWLEMLEAQVRHMPVCNTRGQVIGVLHETDLLVAASRGGSLQRRIAECRNAVELRAATNAIALLAHELFTTGLDAESTSGILSLVIDTAARRAVELSRADHPVPGDFAWITLGSIARREAMPSSDIDSALSWADDQAPLAPRFRALARATHHTLSAGGLPEDSNGALAYLPRFSRSATEWVTAAQSWLAAPLRDQGLIMSSLLIDGRVIVGPASLHTAPGAYSSMPAEYPEALRLQLLNALALKPRVRGVRDVIARRGSTLDLKTHVVSPIVNLARWAGLTAGITCAPTPARLHSAADVGTLSSVDATTLHEIFALAQRLRMRHQTAQVAAGHSPGDLIVMADLSPLERSMLAEGIREIAEVQRRIRTRASLAGF